MKRYYNKYHLPPWLRKFRDIIEQFTIPLAVFQLIRTLLFPTTFDVLLLAVLVLLAAAFYLKWI